VINLTSENRPIGFIDLFDFEPKHKRVGLGIIVFSEGDRRKGYASQSLEIVCSYAFEHLHVHQVYANITEDNTRSIEMFKKVGFLKSGVKKDWIVSGGKYKNEILFQLIQPQF
jgi:diamine N-acetyltransferase